MNKRDIIAVSKELHFSIIQLKHKGVEPELIQWMREAIEVITEHLEEAAK
jgi:hypothetical protein